MKDEDLAAAIPRVLRNAGPPNFEEVLETLILIAQGRGRKFLAYLLIMALMHAREEDLGEVDITH
jgi:hypothetical protein